MRLVEPTPHAGALDTAEAVPICRASPLTAPSPPVRTAWPEPWQRSGPRPVAPDRFAVCADGATLQSMNIVIAGGHGQIAMRLTEIMAPRGHSVTGLVRNPDHTEEVAALGGRAVVCDLEQADVEHVAGLLDDVDAVVFAAGAGPGSGAERKDTVDRAASVLLADAAERAGVNRFVQISTMGAGAEPDRSRGEVWAAYIEAKTRAEEDLRARDLDWVIVRPGRLTDEEPTGKVALGGAGVRRSEVSRGDVAAVLARILESGALSRRTLELVGGEDAVDDAVAALAEE